MVQQMRGEIGGVTLIVGVFDLEIVFVCVSGSRNRDRFRRSWRYLFRVLVFERDFFEEVGEFVLDPDNDHHLDRDEVALNQMIEIDDDDDDLLFDGETEIDDDIDFEAEIDREIDPETEMDRGTGFRF